MPWQNGRHFADDTFKCIFLNENVRISIKNSPKIVPNGPINNIPALVQIMAWCWPGDKPLSEPMMVRLPTHICDTRPQWVLNTNVVRTHKCMYTWTCTTPLYVYLCMYVSYPVILFGFLYVVLIWNWVLYTTSDTWADLYHINSIHSYHLQIIYRKLHLFPIIFCVLSCIYCT